MRTRHSPNLYEILRSASAPKENPPGPAVAAPPPPEVQEPDPIIDVSPPPIITVERPPAPRIIDTPPPRPVQPAPPPPVVERYETPAPPGPGERSLRVTYNTLLFAGLVAVGVVFLAFTLGIRTGRSHAEALPAAPELEAAAPQEPAVPARKFTIRLVEYRARTSQEYTKALDAAIRYKNELERLGLREGVVETLGLTPDRRVVLRYGEYEDAAAPPAKETLQKLKNLKLDKASKEATFSRTAQFQTR